MTVDFNLFHLSSSCCHLFSIAKFNREIPQPFHFSRRCVIVDVFKMQDHHLDHIVWSIKTIVCLSFSFHRSAVGLKMRDWRCALEYSLLEIASVRSLESFVAIVKIHDLNQYLFGLRFKLALICRVFSSFISTRLHRNWIDRTTSAKISFTPLSLVIEILGYVFMANILQLNNKSLSPVRFAYQNISNHCVKC